MSEKRSITKRQIKEKTRDPDKNRTFTFTVPERHLEHKIIILAAGTPIAIKPEWADEIFYKTAWCNLCGKCCILPEETYEEWELGYKWMEIDGHTYPVCTYLDEEVLPDGTLIRPCRGGPMTPQGCIVHNGVLFGRVPHPDCTIRYDKRYEIVEE